MTSMVSRRLEISSFPVKTFQFWTIVVSICGHPKTTKSGFPREFFKVRIRKLKDVFFLMSHNLWLIVSLSRNYTASVWHCVSWRMVGPWQLGSWKLGHDKYALQARVKSKFSKRANLRNWSRNRPKTKLIGVYSNGALISVSVKMDPRNSTKSILVIDQDGLTLPDRQYYMNAPRNDYFIIACFS